jgi:flavin-binding protein dodecin
MSVAKVIEISSASEVGFEDAIAKGIDKAAESVREVRGAWVAEQKVKVSEGRIVEYRVDLKVSFVLD